MVSPSDIDVQFDIEDSTTVGEPTETSILLFNRAEPTTATVQVSENGSEIEVFQVDVGNLESVTIRPDITPTESGDVEYCAEVVEVQ